jgi:glycosyltransferase involved in cell wall biosynthesis
MRFSAVVVSCNEGRHLARCLERLAFCDEIVVIDLESTDDTAALAKAAGARVVAHERVPVVEPLREQALALTRNDWVIYCDPDEIQPRGLGAALEAAISENSRLGLLGVRSQYHFLGRPLTSTAWGVRAPKYFVAHRERVAFSAQVHVGLRPLPGFERAVVGSAEMATEHLWVDSIGQLLAKHRRYLDLEGAAMHARGQRYRTRRAARDVAASLKRNLWNHGALLAGPRAWFLTVFHAGYTALCWRSLRRFERASAPAPRTP